MGVKPAFSEHGGGQHVWISCSWIPCGLPVSWHLGIIFCFVIVKREMFLIKKYCLIQILIPILSPLAGDKSYNPVPCYLFTWQFQCSCCSFLLAFLVRSSSQYVLPGCTTGMQVYVVPQAALLFQVVWSSGIWACLPSFLQEWFSGFPSCKRRHLWLCLMTPLSTLWNNMRRCTMASSCILNDVPVPFNPTSIGNIGKIQQSI